MYRLCLIATLPVFLLGCDAPHPPTITSADIDQFDALRTDYADRTAIESSALPTGTVTYSGQFGGDLSVNGVADYGLLGTMALIVDFNGDDGAVTGQLTDINLLEAGTPNQRLGGSMVLNGDITDGTIDARATGNLSAVSDRLPVRGDADIALNFDGLVVEDPTTTAVTGIVSGTTSANADFQLSVQNGFFYGTETPLP